MKRLISIVFLTIIYSKSFSQTVTAEVVGNTLNLYFNLELTTTRLSAYPNPATDNVTIDFDVTTNEVPVTIYSTSGKLVYSSQDKPTNGTNSLTIDVSTFNKGIYLVKAGSSVQKLIVE